MKTQCHCGNIQLAAPRPQQVTRCNCSICSRYKALWAYYSPEEVQIVVGDGGEDIYCWGDKMIEFIRCGQCGCVTHYQTIDDASDPRVGINLSMLDEEWVKDIPVRFFDGKNQL